MSEALTSAPTVRPATIDDMLAFFPAGFPHTVRAWVIAQGDDVLGLGGIAYRPAPQSAYLFSDIRPEIKRYPLTIVKAAKAFLEEYAGIPIVAFSNPEEPGSARFLAFLGFRFIMKTASGFDAYRWQPRRAA